MRNKQTSIMLLVTILALTIASTACDSEQPSESAETEEASAAATEELDFEDGVGDRLETANHAVTLVGYEVFEAAETVGDNTELIVVEFFVENTGQGDVGYALMDPYVLQLADGYYPFQNPGCEGRAAPQPNFFLYPGESASYYICWVVPPAAEANILIITYDLTGEVVADDEVSWVIIR